MQYTKEKIHNNIQRALENGKSIDDALDLFLMMNMVNALNHERYFIAKGPSPYEVYTNLIGNRTIGKDDIILKEEKNIKSIQSIAQKLIVKLSPTCILFAEMSQSSLQVMINGKNMTSMYLKSYSAKDVALWMIRQKKNLDKYMEEWVAVLNQACKKTKSKRMAYLAIQAIFTEGMKDYPQVRYEFIEQKRRTRIKVVIPDRHLGVYLDAWWGSYRERLPKQIEDLKLIVDAHRKSTLTNFFVFH